MVIFPRPQTTRKTLAMPTVAHRVACEAAQGVVTGWCRIAEEAESAATTALRTLGESLSCDTADTVALTIRRAVWACWDDRRDSHPESVGRFSLSDGCPEGCLDVCRAAAVIACSVAGLVEPTDDHAAIMESWWQELCDEQKHAFSVDVGAIDVEKPRNALAAMIESVPRWPGEPTPFLRSLDRIAGRILGTTTRATCQAIV